MKMVQMNNKAPVTNDELTELNHRIQDGKKERRERVTRERQGLSEEHESRINEDVQQHVSNGEIGTVQALERSHSGQRRSQQQPQGHLVRWERFLAFRSLKVLLVENDDSTRHIVSALLRNCGYEVTAVENGRQAWKVLEDLVTDVDLVLTEVVMPCLSGIGLLGKIMSKKTCKDILLSFYRALGQREQKLTALRQCRGSSLLIFLIALIIRSIIQGKKPLETTGYLNNEEPSAEKTQAVDLMGVSNYSIDPHMESGVLDVPNELSKAAMQV